MASLLKKVRKGGGNTPPLAEVEQPPSPPPGEPIPSSNQVPEAALEAERGEMAAQPTVEHEAAAEGDAEAALADEDDNLVTAEQLGIPDSAVQDTSESGKFKMLLGILRKALNVKDLSGLRISLPAQLMDPIANLDYWCYMDRPDLFGAISDSDDELERMLALVRWVFTKDLKFVKQPLAKPYNSVIGEHFHAHWDVSPVVLGAAPTVCLDEKPTAQVLANAGRKSAPPPPSPVARTSSDSTLPSGSSGKATLVGSSSGSTRSEATAVGGQARVVFLNEQVSHHPPISHFMLESRGGKGRVRAYGADQVSAKFTGTNVKVFSGPFNRGIFVSLPDRDDEEYQITHPTANIAGLLRGAPYATVTEHCYITCRGGSAPKRLRTILSYTEESWLTRAKFGVEGVIYEVTDEAAAEYTKIKQVPTESILATITGCWRGEITYKLTGDSTSHPLIDMVPLLVMPKIVAPLEQQDALESRKIWDPVSKALIAKDFSTASKCKTTLEQKQRDEAEARKKSGTVHKPRFFAPASDNLKEWDGRPHLTQEGKNAIEAQFKADFSSV